MHKSPLVARYLAPQCLLRLAPFLTVSPAIATSLEVSFQVDAGTSAEELRAWFLTWAYRAGAR
jgi:hypothetical protein